jgi:hypothetical protein
LRWFSQKLGFVQLIHAALSPSRNTDKGAGFRANFGVLELVASWVHGGVLEI